MSAMAATRLLQPPRSLGTTRWLLVATTRARVIARSLVVDRARSLSTLPSTTPLLATELGGLYFLDERTTLHLWRMVQCWKVWKYQVDSMGFNELEGCMIVNVIWRELTLDNNLINRRLLRGRPILIYQWDKRALLPIFRYRLRACQFVEVQRRAAREPVQCTCCWSFQQRCHSLRWSSTQWITHSALLMRTSPTHGRAHDLFFPFDLLTC